MIVFTVEGNTMNSRLRMRDPSALARTFPDIVSPLRAAWQRRLIMAICFSLESTLVLVGLTTSLLILPPLPHPSFMLLLIRIGIMVC
ncbi:unnamed protein product [Brassica oleracea var. botrytis]|uniref:(rape) hypothetical protein n=1 Tax=Brassica napus TaxID=3708 RepID=A0A816KLD7_BRANA|nr:unnamed protein product [Brassica napus]